MKSKYWALSALLPILAVLAVALPRSPRESEITPGDDGARGDAAYFSEPRNVQTSATAVAADSASAAEVDALAAQLTALRGELNALKKNRAPESNDSSEPDGQLTMEEQRQLELQRTMQTVAFLESNLQQQTKDPSWSLSAEQQVSAAFQNVETASGSELQALACQATLCRIESQHADANAERAFISRLGRLDAFGDGEAFSQRKERPDGSVAIVTYVTRSGHRLPPI